MYQSLTNVALLENEWIGPGLIGTIEFESDGQYIFQGALIPTTERLFVNLERSDEEEITNHQIDYTDISIVTVDRRALSGKVLNFWIDDKVEVSMSITSEKNLRKFLEFYRKHRAHALKFEKMRYGKVHQM